MRSVSAPPDIGTSTQFLLRSQKGSMWEVEDAETKRYTRVRTCLAIVVLQIIGHACFVASGTEDDKPIRIGVALGGVKSFHPDGRRLASTTPRSTAWNYCIGWRTRPSPLGQRMRVAKISGVLQFLGIGCTLPEVLR